MSTDNKEATPAFSPLATYRANVPPHCISIHNFGRHSFGLYKVVQAATEATTEELDKVSRALREIKKLTQTLPQASHIHHLAKTALAGYDRLEKAKLEKLCQEIEDHCTQEGEEAILPNGRSAGICSFSARLITELRGGEVYGYEDQPDNFVGAGGHDFALVDNRYLIDWWNHFVTSEAPHCVFDLEDPQDEKEIARLYPSRENWVLVPPPPMITQR